MDLPAITQQLKDWGILSSSSDYQPPTTDVLDKLDLKHAEFKRTLTTIAYKNPTAFFEARNRFVKALVEKQVKDMYTLFYQALTSGKIDGTQMYIHPGSQTTPHDAPFRPNMSRDKANKVALDFVATIHEAMEQYVIDKLFPDDLYSGSLNRASRKPDNA